jgi:hypothetical protein
VGEASEAEAEAAVAEAAMHLAAMQRACDDASAAAAAAALTAATVLAAASDRRVTLEQTQARVAEVCMCVCVSRGVTSFAAGVSLQRMGNCVCIVRNRLSEGEQQQHNTAHTSPSPSVWGGSSHSLVSG